MFHCGSFIPSESGTWEQHGGLATRMGEVLWYGLQAFTLVDDFYFGPFLGAFRNELFYFCRLAS